MHIYIYKNILLLFLLLYVCMYVYIYIYIYIPIEREREREREREIIYYNSKYITWRQVHVHRDATEPARGHLNIIYSIPYNIVYYI